MAAGIIWLEARSARIYPLLQSIDDGVRRFELDGAELKGRIAGLPTTWAMVTTMIGGQITLACLVFAILRMFGAR